MELSASLPATGPLQQPCHMPPHAAPESPTPPTAGFYHGGLMQTMAGEATRRISEFSQQVGGLAHLI